MGYNHMADTILGDFPDSICSDCGKKGCTYKHWGPLAPDGKSFCLECWHKRVDYYNKYGKPLWNSLTPASPQS